MPEVLGVGSKRGLGESESQRFACMLQEIEELVDFEEGNERIEEAEEVAVHEGDEGGPPDRQLGDPGGWWQGGAIGSLVGFVQENLDGRQSCQRGLDAGADA